MRRMKQLIGAVLKEAAVTDTVVGTLFDEMDDDGNGVVDSPQWVNGQGCSAMRDTRHVGVGGLFRV